MKKYIMTVLTIALILISTMTIIWPDVVQATVYSCSVCVRCIDDGGKTINCAVYNCGTANRPYCDCLFDWSRTAWCSTYWCDFYMNWHGPYVTRCGNNSRGAVCGA